MEGWNIYINAGGLLIVECPHAIPEQMVYVCNPCQLIANHAIECLFLEYKAKWGIARGGK